MARITTWRGLGISVGSLVAVAAICIGIGNTSLGAALIVVAVLEGAAHALLIAAVAARRTHRNSRAA